MSDKNQKIYITQRVSLFKKHSWTTWTCKNEVTWLLFTLPSLKTDKESTPWSLFPQREKIASEKTIPVFSQCPIWVHRWIRQVWTPHTNANQEVLLRPESVEKKTTPNSTDRTTYRRDEDSPGLPQPFGWTLSLLNCRKRRWLWDVTVAAWPHATCTSLNTKKTNERWRILTGLLQQKPTSEQTSNCCLLKWQGIQPARREVLTMGIIKGKKRLYINRLLAPIQNSLLIYTFNEQW